MKISIRVTTDKANDLTVEDVLKALPTINGVVPTVEDIGNGYCQDVVYKMGDDFKYWDLLPILKASGVNGSMNSKGRNPYIFLQHEQTDNGNETLPEFYDTMDNMERRENLTGRELLDEMKSIDIKRWGKSISTGALDGQLNVNNETVGYAIRNLGFDLGNLYDEEGESEWEDEAMEIRWDIEEYMFNSHYIDRIEELTAKLTAIETIAKEAVNEGYFDGGYYVPEGADQVYYEVLNQFGLKEPENEEEFLKD